MTWKTYIGIRTAHCSGNAEISVFNSFFVTNRFEIYTNTHNSLKKKKNQQMQSNNYKEFYKWENKNIFSDNDRT